MKSLHNHGVLLIALLLFTPTLHTSMSLLQCFQLSGHRSSVRVSIIFLLMVCYNGISGLVRGWRDWVFHWWTHTCRLPGHTSATILYLTHSPLSDPHDKKSIIYIHMLRDLSKFSLKYILITSISQTSHKSLSEINGALRLNYREEFRWWISVELARRFIFLLFFISFPRSTVSLLLGHISKCYIHH